MLRSQSGIDDFEQMITAAALRSLVELFTGRHVRNSRLSEKKGDANPLFVLDNPRAVRRPEPARRFAFLALDLDIRHFNACAVWQANEHALRG